MELKGFQNWNEQNPIYNNLMTLNWVQKAQENLVAEVVDRIRNAFWSPAEGEVDPEEEKALRNAAEIILTNTKQEASKKLAEEWIFNIFISKLTTDEEIRILVNRYTKMIPQSKSIVDFSEKMYENIQIQLLQNFDEEKSLSQEFRSEMIQELMINYWNMINNSFLHRIKGKNFLKTVKEAFIKQFLFEWKSQIRELFESTPNIERVSLAYSLEALKRSKSEMLRVFPEFFFQMIKKELHEKYVRKVNSSTQKTKISKTENTELPTGFNLSTIIDESIEKNQEDKALQDEIQSGISGFNLTPQERKQLQSRLFRLKKNKKPLKTSDYLSEENTLIKAQDEGKFLDLIDQLGIEIIREENTSNNEKATTKSETTNAIESKEETTYPQKELETWFPNLETPEEITDHILEQLEKCDYTFTNKEKFRKEVLEFSKQKLHKDLLLWAAIDFQSPEKKSQSIFTIKIWWSARIFLIKQNGEFTVEKFCKNHNEYETYFSFLRKSFD